MKSITRWLSTIRLAQWTKVLSAILFLTADSLPAATKIWAGSSSGFWNTAANWSPSGVPANGDDLLFPTGPTRLQITNNIVNLRPNQITFSGTDYWLWGNPITLTNGIIAAQSSGFANIVGLTITNGANVTLNIVNSGAYLYMETNIVLGATTLTNTGSGFIFIWMVSSAETAGSSRPAAERTG